MGDQNLNKSLSNKRLIPKIYWVPTNWLNSSKSSKPKIKKSSKKPVLVATQVFTSTKMEKLINPEYVEIHYANFVESKEDFDKIIKEKEVVFVDFTASWCPPCKMIKPVFEEWAEKFKDNDKVKFVKV